MKSILRFQEPPKEVNLNDAVLQQILSMFSKRSEAAKAIMELLSLNRDGVYRRLRGDTLLSITELQILVTHFDISLDKLLSPSQNKKISFSYSNYKLPVRSFWDHLKQVHGAISQYQIDENYTIRYSSKEIPFFIYMMFPKILAFKLYVFGSTTWDFNYLKDRKFNFSLVTPQEYQLANTITQIYNRINSQDVWTVSILDQTINQIEYMAFANKFEQKEDAISICSELLEMIDHTRKMAKKGRKFTPGLNENNYLGDFDLFHNEITGANNIILVSTEQRDGLYHTFDTPNFIYSSDKEVCHLIHDWFDRTISSSISMSIHSSKSRNLYFNKLRTRVTELIIQLDNFFD